MLILIAVAAGMFGGVFAGMYFGKVYPVRPGEWRHHVYLALGIILILLAAALAAFLAVCH